MRLIARILLVAVFLSAPAVSSVPFDDEDDPNIAALLAEGEQDRWLNWIAKLSGAQPVSTNTSTGWITTRDTFTMFSGNQSPDAFSYLIAELGKMGFSENQDFQIHTYAFPFEDRYPEKNWKNLILTFPGTDPTLAKEKILLVAHLDSTSETPNVLAPGADDNASGAAGLLEAAARLRHFQFGRTIHLIWFTGEEQSRMGSHYFVEDFNQWLPNVMGVINLDMFAFDWDQDRCFEIHTGTQPESQAIGRLFGKIISEYDLNLKYEMIDDENAYHLSDHGPFWEQGIPAVMIFENFFYQGETGCGNIDRNNHYHQTTDTLTYINAETGFAILQSAIAVTAHLAEPKNSCFSTYPQVYPQITLSNMGASWMPLENAVAYQVWVWYPQGWRMMAITENTNWLDLWEISPEIAKFQVVAMTKHGCQSKPGNLIFYP